MKSVKIILGLLLLSNILFAQAGYQQMAKKAIMDGNFKQAVVHLEKATSQDGSNTENLYMLGYSYYHAGNYMKAISTFDRLINLQPSESSYYYYRGKARNITAMETIKMSMPEREKYLQTAIRDFTKAIQLNDEDVKLYQNRALAYRDHGTLRGQRTSNFYDRSLAATAIKASINDFQKVLQLTPGRKDITVQLDNAKEQMASLK
ncbi:MAG TPA: tetratricopeptide repeat protein [Sphingobacteriaceae bacterium]|nr:tetratricopeptide repeat protein [Sphingobacteriaceae bacterium]